MEIRIATMSEFHKNGGKEPFLWNRAAYAVRINRKAVDSADLIIEIFTRKVNEGGGERRARPIKSTSFPIPV